MTRQFKLLRNIQSDLDGEISDLSLGYEPWHILFNNLERCNHTRVSIYIKIKEL